MSKSVTNRKEYLHVRVGFRAWKGMSFNLPVDYQFQPNVRIFPSDLEWGQCFWEGVRRLSGQSSASLDTLEYNYMWDFLSEHNFSLTRKVRRWYLSYNSSEVGFFFTMCTQLLHVSFYTCI